MACLDKTWKPKSIEDSVDAGVHPVVAAMRLAQKASPLGNGTIVEGMDLKAQPWLQKDNMGDKGGYTYQKRNGAASATPSTHPTEQINRLAGQGVNPQDFFRLSKQSGLNPMEGVLRQRDGPGLPDMKKEEKKKDKKKKKKEKSKKKKKKAKSSSSSSSSSASSSSSSSDSSSSESEKAGKKRKKPDKKEKSKKKKK